MNSNKIIHFVWGGGSGSTKIAMSLTSGHIKSKCLEPLLVLRIDPEKNKPFLEELQNLNIPYEIVPKKPKRLMIKQFINIIKTFQPTIVVAHGYREHIYGRIAAVFTQTPIIIQVEHSIERYKLSLYIISRILEKFTNRIICVSDAVKQHLTRMGFNANKMEVIYNAINMDKYVTLKPITFNSRIPEIIMVARFSPPKNHYLLIKAAHILKNKNWSININLVGDGRNKKKCERLCVKMELSETVHFLGHRDDVEKLLAKHQIFVLTTMFEGFGLVVIEAMAAGCVVITSNVPAVSELIRDGETGFLVSPTNPKCLANKIEEILSNPDYAEKIAEAGQKYAIENFHINRMVKEYEELFLRELNKTNSQ